MGCEITRTDLALRCVCVNSTQTAIRLETEGNPPTITESRMEVRLAAKHCQLTVYLLIIYSLCLLNLANGTLNKQFCVCVVNYSIKNSEHKLADEQQFKFHVDVHLFRDRGKRRNGAF